MDSRSQGRVGKAEYAFLIPNVNVHSFLSYYAASVLSSKQTLYSESVIFVSHQALRARYEGGTREEAFHLVKARHWSLGHNVILSSLASDAIINGRKIKIRIANRINVSAIKDLPYTTNDI